MRLNRDIRYQISALLAAGHQQKVIAKLIGISEGGLSKEISRNGGRKKYDPDKADKRAVKLQHKVHIHYEYSVKYGGLEVSQLKKLKELEEENAKLKKMYANLALDNEILREVIEKKL